MGSRDPARILFLYLQQDSCSCKSSTSCHLHGGCLRSIRDANTHHAVKWFGQEMYAARPRGYGRAVIVVDPQRILSARVCSKNYEGGGSVLYRNNGLVGATAIVLATAVVVAMVRRFVACICGYRLLPRLSSCRPWLATALHDLSGRPTNSISGGEM